MRRVRNEMTLVVCRILPQDALHNSSSVKTSIAHYGFLHQTQISYDRQFYSVR